MAGIPFHDDEIIFYVLPNLSFEYKEIDTTIRACDYTISFTKLHNKLTDFKDLLKHTSPHIGDFSTLSTAHVTTRFGSFSRGSFVAGRGDLSSSNANNSSSS